MEAEKGDTFKTKTKTAVCQHPEENTDKPADSVLDSSIQPKQVAGGNSASRIALEKSAACSNKGEESSSPSAVRDSAVQ